MPPPIALALTLLLIGYLLRRDAKGQPPVSPAAWIPTLWLMINGSRQVSQWIDGPAGLSAQALSDGNSVDKVIYSLLIAAAVWVLVRRRVRVGEILRSNLAIVLLLLYAALSVLWSEFPLISLKRWIKAIGDPIMVLVLWSDPAPARAITAMVKRCAYVLLPVSVLFCKYYEHLGRTFDSWGKFSYTGVTTDKNMFGYLLFLYGLFFVATLLTSRSTDLRERHRHRSDKFICLAMLVMVGWLIPIANSKTATVALAVGIALVVALQFAAVRRHFWLYALAAIALVTMAEELFSVKTAVLDASDRDATFTGRTGLWETVLEEPINPIFGAGYGGFWLGERLDRFWAMYPTSPPIQAHNGYIEVYLNLGLIGLILIASVLLSGLRTIQRRAASSAIAGISNSHDERTLATFGLAFSVAYLLYNITEATFQGLNPLFMIFLILAFDPKGMLPQSADAQRGSVDAANSGAARKLSAQQARSWV